MRVLSVIVLAAAAGAQQAPRSTIEVPLYQITRLHGSQPNVLEGIGVVVGLAATGAGDSVTRQALANFIRNHGLNVRDSDITSGAAALVRVTATLPAFSHEGMEIDVRVDNLAGDATSLFGGDLISTPLQAIDGEVYALAAGRVSVGGFTASGKTAKITRNHPTVGHIVGGARVVRQLRSYFLSEAGHLELRLIHPDERTALGIAGRITEAIAELQCRADAVDRSLVRITLSDELRSEHGSLQVLGRIRDLMVATFNPTTVVIDEATGLVLAGEGVMISPCVVAMEDLTISVITEDEVSQPLPGINQGQTVVVPRTQIDVSTDRQELQSLRGGASVAELLDNLKALELSPRQLVQVFQVLASEGYLQAELRLR